MNSGRLSPIVRSTSVGIRHMNQPLKSTSIRRCSQRELRRLRPAKSQSFSTVGGDIHQKRYWLMISPKLCSRDLLNRLNMWPPTIVGRRQRSPNVTARRMLSGSQTTSSSMHIMYVDRPASSVSNWARA